MNLTLLMTNRCNARCEHCGTCSSPEDASRPALDEFRDWIDQAAAISGRNSDFGMCLSGGEPFLFQDELLSLVQYTRSRGARTSCVTNAFWATSCDRARAIVSKLKRAGLALLCISHDSFHTPYIPSKNVETTIRACIDLSLSFSLNYVLHRGAPRVTELLKKLESITLDRAFTVNELLCMPFGRAETMPKSMFIYRKTLPSGKCPWLGSFVANQSGDLFPCCIPGWPKQLYIGNLRDGKLSGLVKKAKRNPLLRILHEHGPAYFVPAMNAAGCGFGQDSFVNECHLCHAVLAAALKSPKAQRAFNDSIRDWEKTQNAQRYAADIIRAM